MEESGYYEIIQKYIMAIGYPNEDFGFFINSIGITPQDLFDIFIDKLGEEKFTSFVGELFKGPIKIDLSTLFGKDSFVEIKVRDFEVFPEDKTIYIDSMTLLNSQILKSDGSFSSIEDAHADAERENQETYFEESVDSELGSYLTNYFGFNIEPTF